MARASGSPRVGILFAGGRPGVEAVVCIRLCELLRALARVDFAEEIVPMNNMRELIHTCGTVAATLFDSGFHRVVILWDERPAWPMSGGRLCWHNDRQDILANLQQARVADRPVHLVCIEREFESWLLFDHRMLSAVLSTSTHPVRVGRQGKPHRMANPKGTMNSLFEQHRGLQYRDIQHATAFASCLQDLTRLRRCATFRRFAERVTGRPL